MSDFRFPKALWANLKTTALSTPAGLARRSLHNVGEVNVFARYSERTGAKEIGFEMPRRHGLDGTRFVRSKGVELRVEPAQNSWKKEMRVDYLYAKFNHGDETMFEAFTGSVPRIVPDNLKTGVIKHPREGEVVLNDAYREMAAHYSAAVLPGRVRAPKDKASVENTVAHVATWIIAGTKKTFFFCSPFF